MLVSKTARRQQAKETSNDPIKSNQSNQLEMQAKVQGSQERKRGGGSCGDGNVYGCEKLYCAVHGGENWWYEGEKQEGMCGALVVGGGMHMYFKSIFYVFGPTNPPG